ncbi:hypothetical protein [Lacicoccus qingdaonensis]|uniref:Uncharacterized protein n=1 Tax=Lacicoccus qingdaonensis TaxID=576118 RepID=A0A1G9EZP3_9BACL|nr:hypothetical protein [Salinicoccus qingdaonensis]SDK81475.1 hypothetical protein SAMN05216216_11060 [Salinicoccus qingdaonensis]
MKISELIKDLEKAREIHGDIEVKMQVRSLAGRYEVPIEVKVSRGVSKSEINVDEEFVYAAPPLLIIKEHPETVEDGDSDD